jgi:hypothetical protein
VIVKGGEEVLNLDKTTAKNGGPHH